MLNHTRQRTEQIEKLSNAIQEADAVVIGAGAGLSTSAGFTYADERFYKVFQRFYFKVRYS